MPMLISMSSSVSIMLLSGAVILVGLIVCANLATVSQAQKVFPGVKITSPSQGQNVSIGTIVTVSGTSNPALVNTTSNRHCYVSVVVNNIKPYRNVTAEGPGGSGDYSKWHFALLPTYALIKQGQNKITSKLSCLSGGKDVTNTLEKWYTVNVTGVSGSQFSAITVYKQNAITSPSGTPSDYTNYKNNNPKTLSISIQSSQSDVNGKRESTITAVAYDAATGKKIPNAVMKLQIKFTSNGTTKEISTHNGEVKYSSEIQPNSKGGSGSIIATVEASAPGYTTTTKTASAGTSATTALAGTSATASAGSITG